MVLLSSDQILWKSNLKILPFFLSWFLCAFGQPARFLSCSFLASILGYALFWYAIGAISSRRSRACWAGIWFFLVSVVQLSWMISFEYQGAYILIFHLFCCLFLGGQFALLEWCVSLSSVCSYPAAFATASLWTLFEWSRLFLLCGFTWNPVGLSLAYSHYPLALASIFGVYGLSFWELLTNGAVLLRMRTWHGNRALFALILTGLPFLLGYVREKRIDAQSAPEHLSVALVQTSLYPEQKDPHLDPSSFIYPLQQWIFVLDSLQKVPSSLDLIALPEVAVPFGAYNPIYSWRSIRDLWQCYFGDEASKRLPNPALYGGEKVHGQWHVTNRYVAQAVANQYDAELILGLDHFDSKRAMRFNGAFHFRPNQVFASCYHKCILVPGGEYLPFSWLRGLAAWYGIVGTYEHGEEPGIFEGRVPWGMSICYEETHSYFLRQTRQMGAKAFINLSNDAWFPDGSLAWQHFHHGRIRGVENGVPLFRATNTGLTAAVDALGRVQRSLPLSYKNERIAGALFVRMPLCTSSTIYTHFGDLLIVSIASIGYGMFWFCTFCKSKATWRKALAEKIAVLYLRMKSYE